MKSGAEKSAEPRVAVWLCACGPNIGDSLDLQRMADRVSGWPGVADVKLSSILCGEEGKAELLQYLKTADVNRLVVGGCTPREHEATIREVCSQAGLNPFLMAWANLREQCAYVTDDRAMADRKAMALLRAAVARVIRQEPIEIQEVDCLSDVAVIGSGAAGLTAALMLAEGERTVYLIEKEPWLGGILPLLGDVEPGDECASCVAAPLLDEVLHHDRIRVMLMSRATDVNGYAGQFELAIHRKPRYIDETNCFGCETCVAACPVSIEDACPWGARKAISIATAGAVPHAPVLDPDHCLRFKGEPCSICAENCPFGNINLDEKEQREELKVGAVILAVGARLLDFADLSETVAVSPEARPFALGPVELERLTAEDGPTAGELRVGVDGPLAREVVYIHPSLLADGPFSKKGLELAEQLAERQLQIILKADHRPRVHLLARAGFRRPAKGRERIQWHPTVALRHLEIRRSGSRLQIKARSSTDAILEADLVALGPMWTGANGRRMFSEALRLDLEDRYFVSAHPLLKSYQAQVQGVLLAGAAASPTTIRGAVEQGSAAAGWCLAHLIPGRKLKLNPYAASVVAGRCSGCLTCHTVCPSRAIGFDEKEQTSLVNQVLCQGCGACVAACPASAIAMPYFSDEAIMAEITALVRSDGDPERKE